MGEGELTKSCESDDDETWRRREQKIESVWVHEVR